MNGLDLIQQFLKDNGVNALRITDVVRARACNMASRHL
jgi:hypothetical protein